MNSNNRIAATLYSLGTLFVSGIYTLHKGDDDEDDDDDVDNNNNVERGIHQEIDISFEHRVKR